MRSSLMGLGCLLFFVLSQGARDAFFGNVFQSVSFLLLAVLAFSMSTVCFSAVALARRPREIAKLLASVPAFAALNVSTAAAWLCFFYGLRHLEPAVAATLYNGMGPLTVLLLQISGWTAPHGKQSVTESLCYMGSAGTLLALAAVVLSNRSGLVVPDLAVAGRALVAVTFGGAMIAISHLIARSFNDAGIGSDAVMGARFLLTLLAAGIAEAMLGTAATRPPIGAVPFFATATFVLITIPSFMLQLGIARSSPLTVNVFRALGPVFVFCVQQVDGRLHFSGATLICIVAFCVFAIGAGILRSQTEVKGVIARSRSIKAA